MEIVLDFLFELLFEGGMEIVKNKKISKWIRYPLLAFFLIIYCFIIVLLFSISFNLLKDNIVLFIILFILSCVLIVFLIKFIKRILN